MRTRTTPSEAALRGEDGLAQKAGKCAELPGHSCSCRGEVLAEPAAPAGGGRRSRCSSLEAAARTSPVTLQTEEEETPPA